jgi:lysophospholipase L1-like esterase
MSFRECSILAGLSLIATAGAASAAVLPLDTPAMAVKVEAGQYMVRGQKVHVPAEITLDIDQADKIRAESEECVIVDDRPQAYIGGTGLKNTFGPVDTGTRLPNSIDPASVRVHSLPSGGTVYEEGTDYFIDPVWGGMSRIPTGAIAKDAKVYVDYEVFFQRIDSIQVSKAGLVSVKKGKAAHICPEPPVADKGSVIIANIYIPFRTTAITTDLIYPLPAKRVSWKNFIKVSGKEYLSNTLALLGESKPINIVCWGDSVTSGGSATPYQKCYVEQFRAHLKAAYPDAKINLMNAGIGGSNTESRHAGYQKEVLDLKPDLITVEFINDMGLGADIIKRNWHQFIADARIRNPKVEFILIIPHFMMASWNGTYEKGAEAMRQIAKDDKVALADTGNIWANLRTIGMPYEVRLANGINHPDNEGHEYFTAGLMKLLAP